MGMKVNTSLIEKILLEKGQLGVKRVKDVKTAKEGARIVHDLQAVKGDGDSPMDFIFFEIPTEVPSRANKVLLDVPVTAESVDNCIESLKSAASYSYRMKLEHPQIDLPVELWINSPGGSVIEGFRLIDFIQTAPYEVHTIGRGVVGSMAFFIFLSGKVRKCTENCLFLIHQLRGTLPSQKYREIYENLKAWDTLHEKMLKILVEKTKLEPDKAKELLEAETWLSAEEALKLGIVDEIIQASGK